MYNGSTKLAIDPTTGNVGIGTSSPQTKLQVLNQIKVSTADQSSGSVVLGDGSTTVFNVGIARWNGSTNAAGTGGMGYFSQGTVNSGGHYFYTGDAVAGSQTERMRLDPNGNVGIGSTSPSSRLHVRGPDATATLIVGNTTEGTQLEVLTYQDDKIVLRANDSSNTARTIAFETGTSERMRIDSSGSLSIGTTSTFASAKVAISCPAGTQSVAFGIASGVTRASGTQYGYTIYRDNTTETSAVTFVENLASGNNQSSYVVRTNAATGGTGVTNVSGGVALVSGGTSWSSYSDLRLKHDVVPITNALDSIVKIDPIFFKWNDRPTDQQRSIGVSAQSVEKVFPELIDRSGMYDVEGGAMQVRYTELIPVLLASIQELKAIVDAQAVEIAALKAK
jgi:hypothetical protein